DVKDAGRLGLDDGQGAGQARSLGFRPKINGLRAEAVGQGSYTSNGKNFQVGEFSTDGVDAPKTLVLKLLKGTNLSPNLPTWDLMMKNIYNLDAYQLTSEDFILNIVYQNDSTGTYLNYLPAQRVFQRPGKAPERSPAHAL
ncbi:MAG: hypothetical protein R6T87_04860, partial [Marinobacter sp.]